MKIVEFIEMTGMSQASLSECLGVSKQAISQWDEIPKKWAPMIEILLAEQAANAEVVEYALASRGLDDFSFEEIQYLCHLRGGWTREPLTDYEIAQFSGLRVWEFNKLIKKFAEAILSGEYVRKPRIEILARFGS